MGRVTTYFDVGRGQQKTRSSLWQAAFFPSGYSEGSQIEIGKCRTHEEHNVSVMMGPERINLYATTLSLALDEAETVVSTILGKSFFWQKAATVVISQRQKDVLNMLMDGYEAKISSKTRASLAKEHP